MNKKTNLKGLSTADDISTVSQTPTIVSPILKRKRGRPKKMDVAMETLVEIVEIGKTIKNGIFPPKTEEVLSAKKQEELYFAYKTILIKEPPQGKNETREFLTQLRDPNLSKARMPEMIESHADISFIEDELTINGGPFRLVRGNWIQMDLGSKAKNETLRLVLEKMGEPSNTRLSKISMRPSTFLYYQTGLLEILQSLDKKKNSTTNKKYENQTRFISWLCMAYLEIIEEQNQDPLENLDLESQRNFKSPSSGIAFFKELLLKQAIEKDAPEGTPNPPQSSIASKVSSSICTKISTGDAVALACVLAEREVEPLKHTYKRETLFKMRAFLASRFFDETKTHRKEDSCLDDKLLSQKPRYKTPCVWLVVNRSNQRSEILAVKPTTNITYWGNPDSEKDKYSIVPINQPQSIWKSIDTAVIKQTIIKHQSLMTAFIVLFSFVILSLGLFTGLPQGREKPQASSLNSGIFNSSPENNIIRKNLEITELSPNNVGGAYNINVNSSSKKKKTSNSNSMEW